MFVLAHLSDPHLPSPLAAEPGELFNKRILGWLSWRLRRRHVHRQEVLDALAHDLRAQPHDHLVVTGDIVNISLPEEFLAAGRWLRGLGAPERVTVIPGNHDAYVAQPDGATWWHWGAHMAGDGALGEEAPSGPWRARFPFVRRRGPITLVALSTAVATAPGIASGTLGDEQRATLATLLRRHAGEFRVVLLHHPPVPHDTNPRKQLTDAAAFRRVIAEAGCELILHGHDHRFRFAELVGADGPAVAIGVASASALPNERYPAAQYHLYDIQAAEDGWRVRLRQRRYDPSSRAFIAGDDRLITLPRSRVARAAVG